jgi:DNA-binding NtrC family response regulator
VLIEHFMARNNARLGTHITGLDSEARRLLYEHPWPGNVRELEHAVERAVLLAQGDHVSPADIGLAPRASGSPKALDRMTIEEVERELIRRTLRRHDGNVSEAAKSLGLSRSALYRRLERHGL